MAASVYTNTAGQGYVFHGSALRPTGVIFANNNGLLYSAYGSGGGFIYSGNAKDNVFPYGTHIKIHHHTDYYNAYDFDTISQLSGFSSGAALGGYDLTYKMYSASGALTSDIYAKPHQYPLMFSARIDYDNGVKWDPSATNVRIRSGYPECFFSANTESSFVRDWYNIFYSSTVLETSQPIFYWFNTSMRPISGLEYTVSVSGHFNQFGPGATSYGYITSVPPNGDYTGNNTLRFSGSSYNQNDFTAKMTQRYDTYTAWKQSGEYPTLSYRAYGVSNIKVAVNMSGYIA